MSSSAGAPASVTGTDASASVAGDGSGDQSNQMRVIKRIVAAQDAFIADLERKNKQLVELVHQARSREVEHKSAEANAARAGEEVERWRAQCRSRDAALGDMRNKLDAANAEISTLRKRAQDATSASQSRSASVQAAEARHKAAASAWAKERDSLVDLVEKTNAMAQSLEGELRKVKAAAAADRQALEAKAAAEREAGRQEGASSAHRQDDGSVAALRQQVKDARARQADAEGMLARLRKDLGTELRRVSNVTEQERVVNQREKKALRAQLEQLRMVTEQRSKLSEQETSALEVELRSATNAAREKESIMERQLAKLMDEVESLTRAHINGQQEGGGQVSGSDYEMLEQRLGEVLKAKEESEAQRLVAEKALLAELETRDSLREEREEMRAAEARKRISECERLLDEWESKEANMMTELQAARSQTESAHELAAEQAAVLQQEIDAARQENAELSEMAEAQATDARNEIASLRQECDRLREQARASDAISRNQNRAREREVETLQALLRKVQAERVADATRQEAASQSLRMDLENAQTVSDERARDLLATKEAAAAKEAELAQALSEAVDALHVAQADRGELESRALAELADVREKLAAADSQATTAASEAAATIERLSTDVHRLAEEAVEARKAHMEQMAAAQSASDARVDAFREVQAGLREQLNNAEQEAAAAAEAAAATIKELQQRLARVTGERDAAVKAAAATEAAQQREVEALQARLQRCEEELRQCEARVTASVKAGEARAAAALARAWQQREAAGAEAQASLTAVVEQLRSRLSAVAAQRASEARAAQAELEVLREARATASLENAKTHELWAQERRRMQETVDAVEARVARVLETEGSKAALVEEELEALRGVKERLHAAQETTLDALNSELDGLKRERQAMAQRAESTKNAVAEVKAKYDKELARLTALQKRQAELSASAQAQRDASRRQEIEQVQADADGARQEQERLKKQLNKLRAEREKAESVTASELKELRSELSHLRRVANEQQLALTKEKKALLDEMERVKTLQQSEQASVVALHREQRRAWQSAADEKVKVVQQEVAVLKRELAQARNRVQELTRLHAAEMQNQGAGLSILRQMEAERERLSREEAQVNASLMDKLQAHCAEVQRLATSERNLLLSEVDTLREELAAKEQVLSRQLRAAQQAAMARLGRSPALVAEAAAKGDKQAAQALVAQVRMQEASKVQKLKAENARLSAALDAAHREAERREQQSITDFRHIRQSFNRFQQLHMDVVANGSPSAKPAQRSARKPPSPRQAKSRAPPSSRSGSPPGQVSRRGRPTATSSSRAAPAATTATSVATPLPPMTSTGMLLAQAHQRHASSGSRGANRFSDFAVSHSTTPRRGGDTDSKVAGGPPARRS